MASAVAAGASAGSAVRSAVLRDRVLIIDGLCNLCNSSARFIIKRDPHKHIKFLSAQSPRALAYLTALGLSRERALQRLIFVDHERCYEGSTAVLEAAAYLRPPWNSLHALLAVPRPLRDGAYDWVAAHRYRWWGRTDRCQVPDTSVLDRYLDAEDLLQGRCGTHTMKPGPFDEQRREEGDER